MSPVPASEEERKSRLLDAMPAIAWSASAQTFRFTYINPAAETLLGYPVSRWLEEPTFWSEHLHPEDVHVPMLCHNETLAGRDHELVYRMIAADGRTVWLRDYVNVHRVNGVPVELFGVMVDITREREAEAASLENRENFQRMVERSPDCLGVLVGDTYVYVNQAFVQLLGAENEAEILGRHMLSFIDSTEHASVLERLSRVSGGESVPYARRKYRRIDGSLLNVEVAALPLRYGRRNAIQMIVRDISDRIRAEEELQIREARLQLLASGTHEAIWEWSPDRGELWTNDAYREMFGGSSDARTFIDEWLARVHPDDRDNAWTITRRAADGEATWGNEYRLQNADGTYRVVLDRGHTVKWPNGERRVIGALLDVTRMREAERMRAAADVRAQQVLEASEQRYRELVDGVSDILYTIDCDGRFVSLSRSFERSTGYQAEEWIGRSFEELFRPREGSADHTGIREYDLPAKSGAIVTVEVSSQPRYIDGLWAGTIGMARDVTEHRTIARKLEESKRMSSLGQVAASLAHEFNNVLMGIQPFVEAIAQQAPPTHALSEAVGHINRAIGRGKRASQEILRFANPKEPQLFAIDARAWIPTLIGQIAPALPPSIALSSSVEPGVSFIRGDSQHLEQVITNLVFNARDAMSGFGTIHLRVSHSDSGFVRISICDSGPGVKPELLERIFEPLFTTKRNGTGLGLAIARRLMERQGGALTVENRAEGGASFHLLVPAAEASSPAIQPVISATPGVNRILIVEDDMTVGAGLEVLLKGAGYQTTWVHAAADARAAVKRTRPHVAIIDVNLPDGNGIDLVPELRAEHEDLPVVLSTGHVELELSSNEKRIISLMKPYEFGDLLSAIGNVTAAA